MSKPYVSKPSTRQFYIPPTLASDFDNFLENDIPNVVMDFIIHDDWQNQFTSGYGAKIIRAEIYPNSTKSRYENMDNQLNFRASVSSGIKAGDIAIDPNGKIYLLDWDIEPEPNNASTRALTCNAYITVQRYQNEQTDTNGQLVSEAGYVDVASAMPCNISRYDGRPEFSLYAGTPGISSDALTTVYIQYNSKTKLISEGDQFVWFATTYTIVDIDHVDVSIDGTSGVIKLICRKKAGGTV